MTMSNIIENTETSIHKIQGSYNGKTAIVYLQINY